MRRPLLLLLTFTLAALAAGLSGCQDEEARADAYAADGPERLTALAVRTESGDSRSFVLADRRGTYFLDRVTAPQDNPAMGFLAGGFRMVDGWRWWFPEDSLGLGPEDLRRGTIRPDLAVRSYLERDTLGFLPGLVRTARGWRPKRLTEIVTLGEGALYVTLPDSLGVVDFFPAFSDRPSDGYTVETHGDVLLVARANYPAQRGDDPRPVWLAIGAEGARAQRERVDLVQRFPRSLGARDRAVAPGRLRLQTPATVVFATGMTQEEALAALAAAAPARDARLESRQRQLVAALGGNELRTEDAVFNQALAWARISLDQLVVEHEDGTWDIAPGLPGAFAQPGWNMLQTFDAFLAAGRWDQAQDLLRRYARAQRFDQRIDFFGRAPSRFENGQPRFRTADAQAVLVAALGSYLRTTGDANLVLGERRLFWTNPVYVQRGYDDPRQLRTEGGFIRNRANETWVQQASTRGAAVRGPEAIEVQARYLDNLRTMERLATIMGVRRQAEDYAAAAAAFERRIAETFLREDVLADHRTGDGQVVGTLRPSALWALRSLDLDPETERRVLRRLAETLAFPHGVASRPQTDEEFHPFLDEPDFYQPGAARYDGTVWTALAGPLISLLAEHGAPDRAAEQHAHLQRLLLDRGLVGGIAENLDGHPREAGAEPAPGGAPLQPFTLAEFIRTSFQDFAGVRYAEGNDVVLYPQLPASWGRTETTFRVGQGSVRATIEQSGSQLRVALVPQGRLARDARVRVRGFGHEVHVALAVAGETVLPADSTSLTITPDGATRDGASITPDARYAVADAGFWDGFAWAEPQLQNTYPVMARAEEQRRLDDDAVTRSNPNAIPIVARTDPEGDDWGRSATFTYPTGFPPRVLDATYLEIAEDRDYFYFRIEMAALADVDELGFQPTFLALAFDVAEGGQRQVGRGANFELPPNRGYEYIVFVGDGLRIEDHRGTVLGEFPRLGGDLLDLPSATIRFSIPKTVISALPRGAAVTLLVGANEGGQPGRFRPVQAQASERFGGGKINPADPNVYDIVTASVGS